MNSRPCSSEQYLLLFCFDTRAGFRQPFRRHMGFHVVWPLPASLQLGPAHTERSVSVVLLSASFKTQTLTYISVNQLFVFLLDIDALPMKPIIASAVTAYHPRVIVRSATYTEKFVGILDIASAGVVSFSVILSARSFVVPGAFPVRRFAFNAIWCW